MPFLQIPENDQMGWVEASIPFEWPGGWAVSDAGLVITPGYGGVELALLHCQTFVDGAIVPDDHVNLLPDGVDREHPYRLEGHARPFWDLPEGGGVITVAYRCSDPRSSLYTLFEYKPKV